MTGINWLEYSCNSWILRGSVGLNSTATTKDSTDSNYTLATHAIAGKIMVLATLGTRWGTLNIDFARYTDPDSVLEHGRQLITHCHCYTRDPGENWILRRPCLHLQLSGKCDSTGALLMSTALTGHQLHPDPDYQKCHNADPFSHQKHQIHWPTTWGTTRYNGSPAGALLPCVFLPCSFLPCSFLP